MQGGVPRLYIIEISNSLRNKFDKKPPNLLLKFNPRNIKKIPYVREEIGIFCHQKIKKKLKKLFRQFLI